MERIKNMTELFVTKERYLKAIEPCMNLAIDRNKRYGNSIEIMKDNSIIDLILMKLIRTRELPDSDEKKLDEIDDCLNYLVYLKIRRNEK